MESARRIMLRELEGMLLMAAGSSWRAAKREPAVHSFAQPVAATGTSIGEKWKPRFCARALPLPQTGDRILITNTDISTYGVSFQDLMVAYCFSFVGFSV